MNKFLKIFSNMDGSSELLLFLIILVFLMLISILVINKITKNKVNKVIYTNNKLKKVDELIKEEPTIKSEKIKEEKIETFEDQVEEVVKVEEKTSIDKIEELLEEGSKLNPIDLTKFEEEQEANAIISYDELVRKAGAKKIIYEYDYSNNDILDNEVKKELIENKKFIASKVISPVYGVQKDEIEDIIDLEEFNDEEYNSEKEMNETFLKSLKEFRSELN